MTGGLWGCGLDGSPPAADAGAVAPISTALVFDAPAGPLPVRCGSTLRLDVRARDSRGALIPLRAKNLPAGARYEAKSARFVFSPGYDLSGRFTVSFDDPTGLHVGEHALALDVHPLGWSRLGRDLAGAAPRGRWAVDVARNRLLEFAADGVVFTRALDQVGVWSPLAVDGQGPKRPGAVLMPPEDAPAVAVVLEEGLDGAFVFDLARARWQAIGGTDIPEPRHRYAASLDGSNGRAFVFGGLDDAGPRNDVWMVALDSLSWTAVRPANSPPVRRAGARATYDRARDRLLVVGGDAGFEGIPERLRDVWALDLSGLRPSWSLMAPLGPPPPARADFTSCHDRANDRILMWGGVAGAKTAMDEPWELRLGVDEAGQLEWRRVELSGSIPTPLSSQVEYDGMRARVLLIGGHDGAGGIPSSDTFDLWELGLK